MLTMSVSAEGSSFADERTANDKTLLVVQSLRRNRDDEIDTVRVVPEQVTAQVIYLGIGMMNVGELRAASTDGVFNPIGPPPQKGGPVSRKQL
jgi:hypothetical protein